MDIFTFKKIVFDVTYVKKEGIREVATCFKGKTITHVWIRMEKFNQDEYEFLLDMGDVSTALFSIYQTLCILPKFPITPDNAYQKMRTILTFQ
jgi:hypothetical protein